MNEKKIEFVKHWVSNGKEYEKIMKTITFTFDENVRWTDDKDFMEYINNLCRKNAWTWR